MAKQLKRPADLVVLQILLINDIAPDFHILLATNQIMQDNRFKILPPLSFIFSHDKLAAYLNDVAWKQIMQDLTPQRYRMYVMHPLERLSQMLARTGTKLIIISYDCDSDCPHKPVELQVEQLFASRGVPFFRPEELGVMLTSDFRLPDGHPTARHFELLAPKLLGAIDSVLKP